MKTTKLFFLAVLAVCIASAQVAQIPASTEFKDSRVVINQSLADAVSRTGSYSNPSYITSLSWSKITGVPSFEVPLTFAAPFSRSTNTIVFAPCGNDGFILKYRISTGWGCEDDQTISGGTGITSINGITGASQSFANDTNVTMSSSGSTHTLGWTGTLAAGRLNSNVVQAVVNDTNVTGAISGQTLTLNWTGALAAARLNSNVVQAVTNDTNVQGTISGQTLTLVWSGALAKVRQHAATVYTDQANAYSAGLKQTFTSSATTAAMNFAPYAGDPSSLFDGDHWYNSAAGVLKARISSTTKTLAFTDSNITGNAATATALASTPTLCLTGFAPTGILANGNATGCAALGSGGGGGLSGLTAGKIPVASNATTIVDSNVAQHADGSANAGKAITWASAYVPTFSSGGTTTCDLSQSNLCQVNFGAGNTTIAFTNPHGSGPYMLRSCQDSVGGRTYTFPSTAKGFVQPDPVAGTTNCTEQPFTYDATNYQGGQAAVPTSAWHGQLVIEGTAPTCITGYEALYADSTAHAWKVCNGSSGPFQLITSGGDINTSNQVTATHLASPMPVVQGGTGTTSTLTGLVRGNASAMTAAELSGDATTSGSNAVTVGKVNGGSIPASAPFVGTNSSNQIVLASPFTPNAQTATYQVLAADFAGYKTIVVASGTFTITLVASTSQPPTGQAIRVVNYGSGVVTIARSGQNINGGVSNLTLAAASATSPTSAWIVSDATNYFAALAGLSSGGTASTIASGTSALGTSAISANSCATVVTTSASGVASTDAISYSPNADISSVTGYGVASTDGLIIYPYPTTNNVNWRVCNATASSITPGAVTLNWRVVR